MELSSTSRVRRQRGAARVAISDAVAFAPFTSAISASCSASLLAGHQPSPPPSPSAAAPGVTMPESERAALSTLTSGNNTAHDAGHAPCSAAPPADVPAGQCYVGHRPRASPSLIFGASVSRLALLFVSVIIIHVCGVIVAVQRRGERNTTTTRPWKPARRRRRRRKPCSSSPSLAALRHPPAPRNATACRHRRRGEALLAAAQTARSKPSSWRRRSSAVLK